MELVKRPRRLRMDGRVRDMIRETRIYQRNR